MNFDRILANNYRKNNRIKNTVFAELIIGSVEITGGGNDYWRRIDKWLMGDFIMESSAVSTLTHLSKGLRVGTLQGSHCDVNLNLFKPLNNSNFQDAQGMGISVNRQI